MILGTAGLTAGLSVATIAEHKVGTGAGEVVVTGASGGVGSLAVAILAKLGYRVTAVSGKPEARNMLKRLGAQLVQARDVVDDTMGKALLPTRWSGAVDTVGGNVLATILKSTLPTGCVAACGVVGGAELHLTVHPFILRGVHLAGIDSAHCPAARRQEIWSRLAGEWKVDRLDELTTEIGWGELDHWVAEILAGRVTGRVVVAAHS
jgi:putative YhdH/YhfP family quinone oxidoreductase